MKTSHSVTVLPPVDAWSVAFSPDSKHIATGSHLGKVNIFGVESGKKEFSLDTRGKFILSIAYVSNQTPDSHVSEIQELHVSPADKSVDAEQQKNNSLTTI